MERDPKAKEVLALAREVGLAGAEDYSDVDAQPKVLRSLREMGVIEGDRRPASASSASTAATSSAPAASAVSEKTVTALGTRLESFLLTVKHQPTDRPVAAHIRSSADQLLTELRRPRRARS